MKYTSIIILFITLVLYSCKNEKKEIPMEFTDPWKGKEILFPEHPVFTRYATDTIDYTIPNSSYKIVVFADSLGCVNCKMHFPKWKKFIQEIDSLSPAPIPFLFFFQSTDIKDMEMSLRWESFDLPVCIDNKNKMASLNNLTYSSTFQTFLLDQENRVISSDNPIYSIKAKEIYLKKILGQSPDTDSQTNQTIAKVEIEEINLGIFSTGQPQHTTFKIRNNGIHPLIILTTQSNCGCITTTFDKHAAQSGESLMVNICVLAKEKRKIEDSITILCNTNEPIHIRIKGEAN